MVSGVLAERAPDTVRAVVDGGHEIVAHDIFFQRRTHHLLGCAAQPRIPWLKGLFALHL